MIHFPVLRTKRFTAQLKELSIGDAIALASMPPDYREAATTALLKAVIKEVQGVEDPSEWTVQERTLAVCHYIASIQDGDPNFKVGEGRYTDYLAGDKDYPGDSVEAFSLQGDQCEVRHLTGAMAQSIERLIGELDVPAKTHWLVGRMAAQLVVQDSQVPTGGDIDAAMIERMRNLIDYPESEFAELLAIFSKATKQLDHLFVMESGDQGMIVLPREGSAADMPPAMFPAGSCVSELAERLGGKPQEYSA